MHACHRAALCTVCVSSPDVGPEHAACCLVAGMVKQRLRVQRRRGVAVQKQNLLKRCSIHCKRLELPPA